MNLTDPLWLFALALIPLAVVAQRFSRRRARRYAVRFPAAATVALAVTAAARWQRRLPVLVLLLALAAGIVALAGPTVTDRVAIGDASIVLVLDHSGSMAANDVQPTREAAAIKAANQFIDQLPSNIKVGAVAFSATPDTVQAPASDHDAAREVIDSQIPDGGTDTGPALQAALAVLHAGVKGHPPAAIVLLSDGAANLGINPVTVAQQAKGDGVAIYTVALGTPYGVLNVGPFGQTEAVPPDPQLMREIAVASGGKAFDAQTADQLSSIYKLLGSHLGSIERSRDISWELAVVGAVLLLIAIGLSTRTAARVP
jgi:Ca-activated chloride channel homolog